jgi:glycosyltransferase involved in cell wall biosynthesis
VKLAAMRDQVTIVIPTLNEGEAIGPLVEEVKKMGYKNVLVADGYSNDSTAAVASNSGAEVVMQSGMGKAGALATAFRMVRTPYLVVMDGDGSYYPSDIDRFLPLLGICDFAKGVRARNEGMSRLHKVGNSIITKTFDLLFGTFIGDVCSGMYMLKTEMVKGLNLEKHPMTVEQEIAAEVVLSAGSITTVPINYGRRRGGVSKVNTWRQGFRDLLTNFDLARTHNPIMLFSVAAMMALVPAFGILGYASILYLAYHAYHGGYFLGGLVLLVLGAQGFTVATIAVLLRRMERRLSRQIT